MDTLALTFYAGMLAGAMNTLAGGGSFVSLPALIAAGVPPVQANASSTVALFPGGLASAWAYRDGLQPVGAHRLRSSAPSRCWPPPATRWPSTPKPMHRPCRAIDSTRETYARRLVGNHRNAGHPGQHRGEVAQAACRR